MLLSLSIRNQALASHCWVSPTWFIPPFFSVAQPGRAMDMIKPPLPIAVAFRKVRRDCLTLVFIDIEVSEVNEVIILPPLY